MIVVATSYFDTYANYQIGYDLISQSKQTNSSVVTFYGVLNVTGNYVSWNSGSAWVWGAQWGLGTYYSRGSYVIVQQSNVTIYHDANGNFTGTLNGGINTSYKSGNASGQFTLPHIERYATLTSGMNFNDEENPTITMTNQGLYNIRAKLEANGQAHLIERDIPRDSTSYTFDLTEAERNTLRQMCTGKTLTVRQTVVSLNGNNEIPESASWKDYTMSIVNGEPVFNATYEDTNSTTLAITNDNQQIIRNNSTLEFDITGAEAKKLATLVSLKASINGVEYNGTLSGTTGTIDVGELNISSNINALVSLTDSRGFITTKEIPLEILNWEQPTAIIEAQRRNNFYDETDVKVDANYSSLDNKNTISIKLRKKKTTEQSYDTYVDLNDNVLTTILMDNSYDWDVQIVVADKIGTSTYNLLIGKGIPIVFFDRIKRSVGIDCFPENDSSLEILGTDVMEEIDKRHTYSTTETKIGTWIDDKPIYRKVITGTTPNSTGWYTTNAGISNMEDLVNMYGSINFNGRYIALPYSENGCGIAIDYISPNIRINFSFRTGSSPFRIVMEYTKTTD